MSRAGNPYDNAFCESFLRTLKREEIEATIYRDLEDLHDHLQDFLERYYNRCRLHSALGYRTPEEFEQSTAAQNQDNDARTASMSFFRHGKSIPPMLPVNAGSRRQCPLPATSVRMSLQPVIPWRVALPQSPPPLHRPPTG